MAGQRCDEVRAKSATSRSVDLYARGGWRGTKFTGRGFPPVRFLFRNELSLARSDRIDIKKKKLHIHGAIAEDSGRYKCLAKNEADSSPVADTHVLTVFGDGIPSIKSISKKLTVKRGNPATLKCVFEDADEVQWFFRNIGPLETDEEHAIFENGTLVINAADLRDQGFYSCHGITNKTTISYTIELQIACKH